VRFFELDSCLSRNLALYFDDHHSAENCGHCSVCRGLPAVLEYSEQPRWPSDQQLISDLDGLRQHLSVPVTPDIQCRFLAGISVPLFTRNKVRQLSGFGSCENLRYAGIREKIESLSA